jgi:hypothetical protein
MAKIDAVTADSVTAVAERIFRSHPAMAAVGRLDKLGVYAPWQPVSPRDRQQGGSSTAPVVIASLVPPRRES